MEGGGNDRLVSEQRPAGLCFFVEAPSRVVSVGANLGARGRESPSTYAVEP